MQFRRLGEKDLKAVSLFLRRAWRQAGPGALGWSGATPETIAEISSLPFLRGLAGDHRVDFFFAEKGGRVVGIAVNRVKGEGIVELSGIIVLQELIGRGIGSGLFAMAEGAAVKRGASAIIVKTEATNRRALSFYRRKGFVETERTTEMVGETRLQLSVLSKEVHQATSFDA